MIVLTSNRRWMVESGHVDVFMTRIASGQPVGARTHLFRAGPREMLFGGPEVANMNMLAIGVPGSSLREHPDVSDDAPTLLERWITHLYDALATDGPIPPHVRIGPGRDLVFEGSACLRPTMAVGWLRHISGKASVLGRAAGRIAPGALVPIVRGAWITTEDDATMRLLTTEEISELVIRAAMTTFHRLVLAMITEQQAECEEADQARARHRHEAHRAAMTTALSRISAVTARHHPRPTARLGQADKADEEPSIRLAFRFVTEALGISTADALDSRGQERSGDPVVALAHAFRLRSRRVALRGQWWRQDNGPLLGRLANGAEFVALLPLVRGGYEIVDPRRRRIRVEAVTASHLDALAYTFYPPFAERALRVADVLKMGLHGLRRDLLTVILAALAMAALGLVTPLATATLFDTVIPSADRGGLVLLTLAVVCSALAAAALHFVRAIALSRIGTKLGSRLQGAVWDRVLTLPLTFFRQYAAGDLASRAMGIEEIRSVIAGPVMSVLLNAFFSLSNFVLMFWYAHDVAWIAALLLLAAVGVAVALGTVQMRRQRTILTLRTRTAGLVLQLLTGLSKLKIAAAEVRAFATWAQLFTAQRAEELHGRIQANGQAVFTAVFPLVSTLILFSTISPHITTGALLGFIAAFNGALVAVLSCTTAFVGSLSVVPMYELVRPILRTLPEIHGGKRDPGVLAGAIALQRVTFRYHAAGQPVLREVSLRIQPGEFVALVGPSGSGKSTIVRLLLGFEIPESGNVTYDEQDLRELDVGAVRRQIGVVMQNGRLLAGDIYTNIAGSSDATLSDAWDAARMAGFDGDIREMPMGMHTIVSEGRSTLSGGQRQRLLMARAFLRRPRIILLDEATSALDNRTQAIVSATLGELQATRVVVAHRLSTIRHAEHIYVIHAGQIVEAGSFDDLMAHAGMFWKLAQRQLI
jgi:NHLM bacteriocin system ABC transporter ATP-binding protein